MFKRLCARMIPLVLLCLCACGGVEENEAEQLLQKARGQYLAMTACSGHMELTADYGQRVYDYGVDVRWEKDGETTLTLTAPADVAGTVAHIAKGETALEYDGVMLETGPLSDTGLSPVDAVPAILTCLREGFLAECVLEENEGARLLHLTSRDPEKEPGEGVEMELWLTEETLALARAEISDEGFTVLQCQCSDFALTLPDGS